MAPPGLCLPSSSSFRCDLIARQQRSRLREISDNLRHTSRPLPVSPESPDERRRRPRVFLEFRRALEVSLEDLELIFVPRKPWPKERPVCLPQHTRPPLTLHARRSFSFRTSDDWPYPLLDNGSVRMRKIYCFMLRCASQPRKQGGGKEDVGSHPLHHSCHAYSSSPDVPSLWLGCYKQRKLGRELGLLRASVCVHHDTVNTLERPHAA